MEPTMKVLDDNHVDMIEDVKEFHKVFCTNQLRDTVGLPTLQIRDLRTNLIEEEVTVELIPALDSGNIVEIADAIADSIVVLIGTALAYGIPLKQVWKEVHRSNMAKMQPDGTVKRRADGKILKPEGWTPPDIKSIIENANG